MMLPCHKQMMPRLQCRQFFHDVDHRGNLVREHPSHLVIPLTRVGGARLRLFPTDPRYDSPISAEFNGAE